MDERKDRTVALREMHGNLARAEKGYHRLLNGICVNPGSDPGGRKTNRAIFRSLRPVRAAGNHT